MSTIQGSRNTRLRFQRGILSGLITLVTSTVLSVPLLITGCATEPETPISKLTVGIVSYGEGSASLEKYDRFKQYLGEQTGAVIELEPVYNEIQALEQIRRQSWSIVFAPPGLAAIAIDQEQYIPILPLESQGTEMSVLVVRADSGISQLKDLQNRVLALGEQGSAAGYYLPLYDLYGLTLAEIRFAPTPKTALTWLAEGKIDAAALSQTQLEQYEFEVNAELKVIHQSRAIPPGAVLLSPMVDRNQEQVIRQALSQATSDIASDAGYIPTGDAPSYAHLIEFIQKVEPIEANVREIPAVLAVENP
ncbi:MAG: PhnD/SsuA/transferrin family substrate-binding protein [Oculatellaceae cyanobacterium bins.114]|nr:PhnD/SsuA/transferrin family substrate-binding protein [Oculatellaceae cyanobacterium bins.114]